MLLNFAIFLSFSYKSVYGCGGKPVEHVGVFHYDPVSLERQHIGRSHPGHSPRWLVERRADNHRVSGPVARCCSMLFSTGPPHCREITESYAVATDKAGPETGRCGGAIQTVTGDGAWPPHLSHLYVDTYRGEFEAPPECPSGSVPGADPLACIQLCRQRFLEVLISRFPPDRVAKRFRRIQDLMPYTGPPSANVAWMVWFSSPLVNV